MTADQARLLHRAAELATAYLGVARRRDPVGRPVDLTALRTAMGGPLPDASDRPVTVVEGLRRRRRSRSRRAAPDRATSGSWSAAACRPPLAADWLTSAWDQNGGLYVAVAGRGGRRGGRGRLARRAARACRPGRASGS